MEIKVEFMTFYAEIGKGVTTTEALLAAHYTVSKKMSEDVKADLVTRYPNVFKPEGFQLFKMPQIDYLGIGYDFCYQGIVIGNFSFVAVHSIVQFNPIMPAMIFIPQGNST